MTLSLLTRAAREIFGNTDITEVATWTPAGGTSKNIRVFRDLSPENTYLGGSAVNNYALIIYVKSEDVNGIAQGDTMEVNNTTYYVMDVGPDDHGVYEIKLSENQV